MLSDDSKTVLGMSMLDKIFRNAQVGLAIVLGCLLFGSTNGQDLPEDWDKCRCPNVTMWTDSYEAREGETKVFKIVFENPEHEKCDLKIAWMVTNGEIVDGQGTTQMRLRIPGKAAGTSIRIAANMNQDELICETHPTEKIKILPK